MALSMLQSLEYLFYLVFHTPQNTEPENVVICSGKVISERFVHN